MKSFYVKLVTAIGLLGLVLTVRAASAQVQELRLIGSGTGETNCVATIYTGCGTWGWGQATGTLFVDGSFIFRLELGGPVLANGYQGTTDQGVCLPASERGTLTAPNGDTIEYNHVGVVCEEAAPGSPYHFNGTYRITGGTGQYAGAAGGGSVSATWTRWSFEQPIILYFYLHGTILF